MSLYSDYIFEKAGAETIEEEGGFITFLDTTLHPNLEVEGIFYLQEIYVAPEYRESGLAAKLTNQVIQIAKDRGYTQVVGTVCNVYKKFERNVAIIQQMGFKPLYQNGTIVVFTKEI